MRKEKKEIIIADVEDITEDLLPTTEEKTGLLDANGRPIYKRTELGVEQYIAKGWMKEGPFTLVDETFMGFGADEPDTVEIETDKKGLPRSLLKAAKYAGIAAVVGGVLIAGAGDANAQDNGVKANINTVTTIGDDVKGDYWAEVMTPWFNTGFEVTTDGKAAIALAKDIKLDDLLLTPRLVVVYDGHNLDAEAKLHANPGNFLLTGTGGVRKSNVFGGGAIEYQLDPENKEEFNCGVGAILLAEDGAKPRIEFMGFAKYKDFQAGGIVATDGDFLYLARLKNDEHGVRLFGIHDPNTNFNLAQLVYATKMQKTGVMPNLFSAVTDTTSSTLELNPLNWVKNNLAGLQDLTDGGVAVKLMYVGVGGNGTLTGEVAIHPTDCTYAGLRYEIETRDSGMLIGKRAALMFGTAIGDIGYLGLEAGYDQQTKKADVTVAAGIQLK